MVYDWSQIGINEITNLYLYGQLTPPSDLTSDALLRPADYTKPIDMDMVSFMATGPGRFAVGAKSSLVTDFMMEIPFIGRVEGTRQVFHKADLIKLYNDSGVAMNVADYNIGIQQYNYNDSANDYAFRTYVYNSSPFKVSDGADFVIEADGTRHIENYAIYALNDNFDFSSNNGIASIGNPALKAAIDPSGIGRQIEIKFANKEMVPVSDYYFGDYASDVLKLASTVSPGGMAGIPSQMQEIVDNLWTSGITKFIDPDGRPIFYGTDEGDNLSASSLVDGLPFYILIQSPFRIYAQSHSANGVRLIGGSGNDNIVGGEYNDVLVGGDGNDTYNVGAGDTITDSDGAGTVVFENTTLSGGVGQKGSNVYTSVDGAYTYTWSGGDLVINGAITVKNFSNNNLGIHLDEKEDPKDPPGPPGPPGGSGGTGYNPNNAFRVFFSSSPLALDLNSNGRIDDISLANSTTYFDLTQDGIAEKSGWLAPADGLLAIDLNGNGVVDDRGELFGTDPQHTAFDKLAELVDANHKSKGSASQLISNNHATSPTH